MSGLHEECGVFGIWSPNNSPLAETVYYGLYALQHRGQEGCGIAVCEDGVISAHKDIGLVGEVFDHSSLAQLPCGNMAVGHVRYSTTGGNERRNCQPIVVNHMKGRMAVAHNGNLSNAYELRRELELSGAIFHTTSDTETIAYIITKQRLVKPSIEEAVLASMDIIEGAYSLVVMSPTKLIAVRDPHGFRPLCFGKLPDGSYAVSSESCGLTAIGAEFVRDIEAGEMVIFSSNGVRSVKTHCNTKPKQVCIFEYIYFARPDSVIDGISVHKARLRAGRILAESCPAEADIVIGVPDSGLDAALGFSQASGIPYGIGLIKNKYIGRTFISPTQSSRTDKVRIKLSAVSETVRGKRVVLVDDSIVRGTTGGRIVSLLREAGAKEIHFRVSAPPFLHPCYYGTDIDSEKDLIACHRTPEEIAAQMGADSLGYLPAERLGELIGSDDCCKACFNGVYPTAVPKNAVKDKYEMKLTPPKGE
ncbi:amidophosphoribosyltransferase [Ruminococcus albus]|uniref:Amidophosphoribosyltransferase n=1 Tax=Ruminococcus albus 8 TaxID=246199 RepID=E9SFW5_RUMAL|nr:amidophosphoribosyltransferase [Ruminococcus albus]EGC01929.1 amidophosphoribosyltransferase [Ruminococcus albus 8]MBE6872967.1 amidophosphoribosyltransferase [Ruminococcus albus]MCC3352604.1 amidophosphoribosyltransferase [Ruminococcus albus 8]